MTVVNLALLYSASSANVLVFYGVLWDKVFEFPRSMFGLAMSMTGQLIELAPQPRAGPEVIDAVRVDGAYRVLDERIERRPVAVRAPGVGAKLGKWFAALGVGFFGLAVAFVAKIIRFVLGLACVICLVFSGVSVVGGLVTGVANAYNWAAVLFGIAFCSFVVLWALARVELWGEGLALRSR